MNVTYKPKACQGDDAKFEGEVVLSMPDFCQRMEMLDACGVSADAESGKVVQSMSPFMTIAKMVRATAPYVLKVDLKHKADGKAISSWDDLMNDPACAPILSDLSSYVMNPTVGNG